MVTNTKNILDNQSFTIDNLDCRHSFIDCRQIGLVMPNNLKDIHDYKPPRLVKGLKNAIPSYYVEFSAFNAITGKLQRKRIYNFNDIDNLTQRELAGEKIVIEINELLQNGFHFNDTRLKNDTILKISTNYKTNYTLETGLKKALDIKRNECSKRTYQAYSSNLEMFLLFTDNYSFRHTDITKIDKNFAYTFIDYLLNSNTKQGQTINSITSSLKSLFSTLVERNIIKTNIFIGIKKQKEIVTNQNLAYNTEQIKTIKDYLIKHDLLLWRFCQFIFYTFARPAEIRQLTIDTIDLEKNIIYISAQISKTKKERFIYISKPLKLMLEEMNIKNKQPKDLLFTLPGKPSTQQIGTNTLMFKYRQVLNSLNFDDHFTLYSWKHTGNVTAYKNGIDIYAIMKQNGHTSIDTTMKYLKTLGLIIDIDFTNKFDKISI